MGELTSYLQKSALFAGLDDEVIARIAAEFTSSPFEAEDHIFMEGDEADGMYIVGEGEVVVQKQIGLGVRELKRLGPGDHFGEMALVSDGARTASVKAVTDCVCAKIGIPGFNALMEEDARFAQRILRVLTDRFSEVGQMATREVLQAHQALIFSLAKLADSRDPETGAHLYRVRDYSTHLTELLADHPDFRDEIDESFIEGIYLVSPLHDIGKVAIPDGILLKQGKLTDVEFEMMSTHTTIGAEALDRVLGYCDIEAFHMARRVILCHHERYDGKGYPRGLIGTEIPLEARITTMADIYDALLSRRVYKPPYGYEEAKSRIANSRGERFDPVMTDVMIAHIHEFEEIHRKYEDGTPSW